jgi:tetratricopeptide (TPR) repeat protein
MPLEHLVERDLRCNDRNHHCLGAFPGTAPIALAYSGLELVPLAHPHAVLGRNETGHDWDFAEGEAEYKKAFELDPDDATALQWHALQIALIGGREQEALTEMKRAHQLDPLSPAISGNPQAIEELKIDAKLSGEDDFAATLDAAFRSGGWPSLLRKEIEAFLAQRKTKTGYVSPYEIAQLYADSGDKEHVFEWLNTAYQEHDTWLIRLRTDFLLDSLRSDPRFTELVRKVGLPQ